MPVGRTAVMRVKIALSVLVPRRPNFIAGFLSVTLTEVQVSVKLQWIEISSARRKNTYNMFSKCNCCLSSFSNPLI